MQKLLIQLTEKKIIKPCSQHAVYPISSAAGATHRCRCIQPSFGQHLKKTPMRRFLLNLVIVLLIFGCKKNEIEGSKHVHIHVETEDHESIDSIKFQIEKTVPVIFQTVTQGYSDSEGNCTLDFDYNTDHFATYELKIDEIVSGFTYSGNYNNKRAYKLKSKIPDLDFGKGTDFNANVVLHPAAELKVYCKNNSGQSNDLLELNVIEKDSVIFNSQIAVPNLYDTLKIYTTAQKQIKVIYRTIRNSVGLTIRTEILTLNDFETRTLELENEK
jgi:hypothetical protein